MNIIVMLLLVVFASPISADQSRIGIVEQSLGRDFGIVVGDIIDHYYVIQVPANYNLTPASLPPNGDLDYWLELLNSDYELIAENNQLRRYRLHFTFQTFYAPLDVRALTIPPLAVRFTADDNAHQITIPAWGFTMSPIKEIVPRGVASDSTQKAFMKADLRPTTISTAGLKQQIWILAFSVIVLSILWLSLNGYLFSFTRSPFQQAYHEVKKLRKYHADESAFSQALQAVHRAFNRRAKQALFAHQIDEFVVKHPELEAYREKIDDFYQLSAEALYSDQKKGEPADFDQLLRLCKQLAGAEKLALKKT
ncbi:hypothetical protein [Methylophaga sp.]|uniref:hypothetical protein n=1 Tax=Methylophaga sp. TaxID=2024840 RepID=UPI00271E8138|nr:hypothetical protein [Methylophaga sp.]MDO8825056.1 hypothetical protein [Methylophaga sp.]